jgi:hypothetical protein
VTAKWQTDGYAAPPACQDGRAAELLVFRGSLVYSTCTTNKKCKNEEQMCFILKKFGLLLPHGFVWQGALRLVPRLSTLLPIFANTGGSSCGRCERNRGVTSWSKQSDRAFRAGGGDLVAEFAAWFCTAQTRARCCGILTIRGVCPEIFPLAVF